ncbi:putative fungal-specific transcription factor [Teratosphaeria destructans]|uniref:Fungal-specific transcription factor n=1 Tax=Teratosphaeria destructans TaxID=418781 RepID=A0A9W7W6Q7_9PEZI|nr:putative fungal-specific transcription factor [Teratosphaeria destructans]
MQQLDNWLVRQGVDVEATMMQPQSCPAHTGMFLGSLCAKLLLIWPFRGHPDDCFQQHWSIAVACVRLLESLWESRDNEAQQVSIPILIASYPPLYLFEICFGILNGSGRNSEKKSLRSFAKLLEAIVGSRQDLSYAKQLKEISSILVDALTASCAAPKRQRTSGSTDWSSSSSSLTFREMPTDDWNLVYLESLGLDSQYPLAGELDFSVPDGATKSKVHPICTVADGNVHLAPM